MDKINIEIAYVPKKTIMDYDTAIEKMGYLRGHVLLCHNHKSQTPLKYHFHKSGYHWIDEIVEDPPHAFYNEETKEIDNSSVDHMLNVAILPFLFREDKQASDFKEGDRVAMVVSISIPNSNGQTNGDMYLEYGVVQKVNEDNIKVELDAIPGQIETVRNLSLVILRHEVVPLLVN